jgi:hypothetical protein
MEKESDNSRMNRIFNLGFRCGANDRAAAGLPYSSATDWPKAVPVPPSECGSEAERHHWGEGYRMGYVIGAADSDLKKYSRPDETPV